MRSCRSPILFALLTIASGCQSGGAGPEQAQEVAVQHDDLIRVTRTLHEKLTALAAEMPVDDLDWRPMEGVRSVSEVYIHIAADNWYVPALLGWDAPLETGVTNAAETFRAYQARDMPAEEMLVALDASFEFLLRAMEESATELDRVVELGRPTTVGAVWVEAVVHLHEHLGQSIAYARVNEVVPPWSR